MQIKVHSPAFVFLLAGDADVPETITDDAGFFLRTRRGVFSVAKDSNSKISANQTKPLNPAAFLHLFPLVAGRLQSIARHVIDLFYKIKWLITLMLSVAQLRKKKPKIPILKPAIVA